MKIYTIIVTYNGLQWMDFCLGSLRASTVQTTPIIIDNNSSDNNQNDDQNQNNDDKDDNQNDQPQQPDSNLETEEDKDTGYGPIF